MKRKFFFAAFVLLIALILGCATDDANAHGNNNPSVSLPALASSKFDSLEEEMHLPLLHRDSLPSLALQRDLLFPHMLAQKTNSVPNTKQSGLNRLTIEDCRYPIRIIEGPDYVFPKDLASYSMQLITTSSGYVLKDTTKPTIFAHGNTIITMKGRGNTVTTITGGNVVINADDDKVYVNGKLVTPEKTSVPVEDNRVLPIQVPRGSDLAIYASGQFDLDAESPLGTVDIYITGSSDIALSSVEYVSDIKISGSGKVYISKARTVDDIDISGSGKVKFDEVVSINAVNISGSGTVKAPPSVVIGHQSISGSGEIDTK